MHLADSILSSRSQSHVQEERYARQDHKTVIDLLGADWDKGRRPAKIPPT